eukprot:TRINITY_DN22403_c0_g1_i1.p1 TRINITY_DN22403_c0_g1~~TRINITY_DN22403_c0_g1_i1.p1  ORF type:complete len:424 (-),score=80.00 TRINITY_DN22403_c0_g1_i1:116-1387(-)
MQETTRVPLLQADEEPEQSGRRRRYPLAILAVVSIAALTTYRVHDAGYSGKQQDSVAALEEQPFFAAPVFRITASTPYEAGLQHGRMAKERIHGWFNTQELRKAFSYVANEGKEAFQQLKKDNEAEFPHYVEEMRGIAEGAGVTLDQVWVANFLSELENLMQISVKKQEHCSDIYAISAQGYAKGFAHGHNDDWTAAVKPFIYITANTYNSTDTVEKLGFAHCAGITYPACLVGWAPTWNAHGIFFTQNTLVPRKSRPGGLGCLFVQRRAVCSAHGMDEVLAGLTVPGWSDAASMNVVDVVNKRMANVEVWEDESSIVEVTEQMGNYSHFNEFKHLLTPKKRPIDEPRSFVHDLRQSVVDALPPPRTAADVIDRLSNPQVFSKMGTITTMVVNASAGTLSCWCGTPSNSRPPLYQWDLLHFFD